MNSRDLPIDEIAERSATGYSLDLLVSKSSHFPGAGVLAACLVFVSYSAIWAAEARDPVTFFRSDLGRVGQPGHRLPADLADTNAFRWRTPVDPGHSTPIVLNGRVVLTSYRAAARELAVESFDVVTGKPGWRRAVTPSRLETVHSIGSPATASPATDGHRIFVFFGSQGLMALDPDGTVLWERRMGPFQDEYGAGSSPIVVGDRVILLQDHDTDSFLAAYDTATGRELWKTPRPDAVRSYSTPAVWQNQGHTELLVAGALELAGYDPRDGRRRWAVPGLARIVIPTPIPMGDTVLMASWAPGGDAGRRIGLDPWAVALGKWDKDKDQLLARDEIDNADVLDRYFRMDLDQNGRLNEAEWTRHADVFRLARNAILSIRPPSGTVPASASEPDPVRWSYGRGVPYVSTPVADQGAVWMVKDGGIVTRMETATGAMQYEERLPGVGIYHASPVIGDGKVYLASQPGVVSVIDAGPAWKVISSHDFHEKIHATPIFREGLLLVRTDAALYAFGTR